jgi:hypothetical protein
MASTIARKLVSVASREELLLLLLHVQPCAPATVAPLVQVSLLLLPLLLQLAALLHIRDG